MDKPLIVGVDGSEPSLRALDWAVDEAVAHGVPLRIVHASRWEWHELHEPSCGIDRTRAQALARKITASAVERAMRRTTSVPVTSEVLSADPASWLARLSAQARAVVVGSRGHGELAELLLGSVSLSVAAHAVSPVIVVRGGRRNAQGAPHTVVLGIDEPGDARAAADFAFREADAHKTSVTAVHAWRCPAREVPAFPTRAHAEHQRRAEEAVEQAVREAATAHPGVTVRRMSVEGSARNMLLDAARTADLLVVGARRRKGPAGMQLGTVNHAVLHHAACPVAIVPHP
ncbi:universal stress protein [Streptomyces sp. NPDC006627]|uniref:universal stress protein n=1 Tax=Streptomyces sp. NPDC006627 TaxID=3154679 RepID=UPI0033BC7197